MLNETLKHPKSFKHQYSLANFSEMIQVHQDVLGLCWDTHDSQSTARFRNNFPLEPIMRSGEYHDFQSKYFYAILKVKT